jgi:hypothetical protein
MRHFLETTYAPDRRRAQAPPSNSESFTKAAGNPACGHPTMNGDQTMITRKPITGNSAAEVFQHLDDHQRGSSALLGAARLMLVIAVDNAGKLNVTAIKNNGMKI